MLLALLSDTHDSARTTQAALALLASHNPDAYLHAGDLVDPNMLAHFAGIGPFHFIFGNNEYDHAGIRTMALSLGLHCHEHFADLTFEGRRIAMLHGHDERLFIQTLQSGLYDYLIHGHTHVRKDIRMGKTRIINPGALYRARMKTVALLDLGKDELKFLEVSPAADAA